MEPLARLDSKSILAEDIFLEIFDQEDEIMKARMILSLTDRAAELGVKKKFEELLKAYKKVDREAKQRERKKPIAMLDKWTNFEGPYNNMFCGAWVAGEDGIFAQNDSQVETVACYHPILPIERMRSGKGCVFWKIIFEYCIIRSAFLQGRFPPLIGQNVEKKSRNL